MMPSSVAMFFMMDQLSLLRPAEDNGAVGPALASACHVSAQNLVVLRGWGRGEGRQPSEAAVSPKCPSPQDPGAWAPRGCRHRTAAAARAAWRAQGGAGALRAREGCGAEMSKPQCRCFQHIRPPRAAPVWSAQMWPEYALLSHGSRQRASRVLPHPLPWQALGPPTITWSQCKGVNA